MLYKISIISFGDSIILSMIYTFLLYENELSLRIDFPIVNSARICPFDFK